MNSYSSIVITALAFLYFPVCAQPLESTTDQIKLYPNPVNDYFFVELKFENQDSLVFRLIDHSGKNIMDLKPQKYAHQWYKVDISSQKALLNSGPYFLQINSGNKIYTARLFIE